MGIGDETGETDAERRAIADRDGALKNDFADTRLAIILLILPFLTLALFDLLILVFGGGITGLE